MEPNKAFEILRAELTYEANLTANRTSWFIASQSFLFTALASALDRTPGVPFALQHSLLFPLIPLVALLVCLSILLSLVASIASANTVRRKLNSVAEPMQLEAHVPRDRWVTIAGLQPSILLPVAFAVCWTLILLR